MRKLISFVVAVFVAVVGIIVPIAVAESASAAGTVSINDPQFRKLLNLNLGKSNPSASITTSEMATISSLNISLSGGTERNGSYGAISDLRGLETATNLTSLVIHDGYGKKTVVGHLDAIGSLTKLQDLLIEHVGNTDLHFISDLRNLRSLGVYNVPFSSLAGFGNLTKLTRININYSNVYDVSAIGGLSNLEKLDLRFNRIIDVSALAGKDFIATEQNAFMTVRDVQFNIGKSYGNVTYEVGINNPQIIKFIRAGVYEVKDITKRTYGNLVTLKSSDGRHAANVTVTVDVTCTPHWDGPETDRYYVTGSCTKLKNAWQSDGSKTYYLNGQGHPLKGFQKVDGYYYIFDDVTGAVRKNEGLTEYRGSLYYVLSYTNPKGRIWTGWRTVNGKRYFLSGVEKDYGKALLGWNTVGKDTYYFWPSGPFKGSVATGTVKIEGKYYIFNGKGVFISRGDDSGADLKVGWVMVNGRLSYYLSDGTGAYGWQDIGNDRYYFFAPDDWVRNRWFVDKGAKYFFDEKGVMAKGWRTINAQTYYFNSHGRLVTGKQKIDGKYYIFDDHTGALRRNEGITEYDGSLYYVLSYTNPKGRIWTGWRTVNGKRYFFSGSQKDYGKALLGWNTVGKDTYYFWPSGPYKGTMAIGKVIIEGKTYIFNANGSLFAVGDSANKAYNVWKTIGNQTYYFGVNGKPVTGFQKVDGYYYIFDDVTGAVRKNEGLTEYRGSLYYVLSYTNPKGRIWTGWRTVNGKRYFLSGVEKDYGKALLGWNTVGKDTYYFWPSGPDKGSAATGSVEIDGKNYVFESDGRLRK